MSNVPRQRKDDRAAPGKASDPELGAGSAGGGGGGAAGKAARQGPLRMARARPVTTVVVALTLACAIVGVVSIARALIALVVAPPAPSATLAAAAPPPPPPAAAAAAAPILSARASEADAHGGGAAARLADGAADPAGAKWEAEHDAHVAAALAQAAVEAAAEQGSDAAAAPPPDNGLGDGQRPPDNAKIAPPPETQQNNAADPARPPFGGGEPAGPGLPAGCLTKFEPGKLGSDKVLCVTDEFFFDITVGNLDFGRIVVGVFGAVVPNSAANFRALATCTGAFADPRLCFRGDTFHRIVNDFVIQGGSKATGRSIFGSTFREELAPEHHSFLSHAEMGVVSWAEYPIGSQFFITTTNRNLSYLDKNHVVFAIVTEGMSVLERIAKLPTGGDSNESPAQRVAIANCGELRARPGALA